MESLAETRSRGVIERGRGLLWIRPHDLAIGCTSFRVDDRFNHQWSAVVTHHLHAGELPLQRPPKLFIIVRERRQRLSVDTHRTDNLSDVHVDQCLHRSIAVFVLN